MKEYKYTRQNMFSREVFTATIIFALLSTLFFFSPVQSRTAAQTVEKSFNQKLNDAPAVSPNVVISQIYGGGGNSGSVYKNDFIELFNRGTAAASLNGWSVQYASAAGTSWAVTNLTNVSLQPGQYYLVQEAAGTGGTTNLPTPDATGSIAMSGTAGKIALVNTTTALSGAVTTGTGPTIVDFIGFGTANGFEGTAAAPAPSNTTADLRAGNGCSDTDQNNTDFATGAPTPRNTTSTQNPCGGTGVTTISINNVTVTEGNSGITTATFTVSLSAPAGADGVTFDIATADNTATVADFDYAAKSLTGQTIAAGDSTYTFDVNINGDTTTEPNETFYVNVTNVVGASPTSVQGTGTINNDDFTLTAIDAIQGSGSTSPFVGQTVTTSGIVTATKSNGFFLQTPDANVDADPNTSEGIFVFTSSTPPTAATIGNSVAVTATVSEYIPTAAPHQPPVTELVSPSVTQLSVNNALPVPMTISAADTNPNNLENLERYEGMRVHVDSLTVVGPTQGNITEPSATVSSTGLFYGVVTGVARPFREPGIDVSIDPPAGAPANVPRFDTNPERLRIDSDTQPGAAKINVAAGEIVSGITGPLDYAFVTWSIYPDAATPPTVSNIQSAIPVPQANADEFTVSSFNMQRFFDTTDDPSTSDPVLTQTAFDGRLNKASLAIRNVMLLPDVVGVEEMENLTTLQAVANKVNSDATAAGQTNPMYQPYLVEGNDVGGIDVGFLVKSSRVTVIDVTQVGKDATYTNPNNGTAELLNDRPPLVLRASIQPAMGAPVAFTVIVNHLRSLSSVDDPTDGNRVRTKRRAQAEYLANLIQARQTADPTEKIISIGDYNAFQFNDGYVDSIGTIKGTPTPADQVTLASPDLVNPDLTDLLDYLPATQRYSFNFDGNAQVLDHELVNNNMLTILNRIAYARNNSDFPEIYYQDFNRPERISDHDMAVAYFSLTGTGGSQTIEGDVSLRPNGNGSVDADDIEEIRRFSVGLDMPYQSNEFQRADVAPRSSEGDGFVDADDIQQARRYAVGTDSSQIAGGPSSPSSPIAQAASGLSAEGKSLIRTKDGVLAAPAAFRVDNQNTSPGSTLVVPIRVDTVGNEAGYTFSIAFDSTILTNPMVAIGNGGGDVVFNTNNPGQIGFSVTSFSGGTIAEGNNIALVNVTFTLASGAPAGTTPITFTDTPARRKASGVDPNTPITQPTYTGGTITISGATAAGAAVAGRVLTANGRGIGSVYVTLTDADGDTRTAVTTSFGYYRFEDVPAGQTYVIGATAKRYTFGQPTRVLNLNADDYTVNFVAIP